jgi:hypothetical protein
VNTNDALSAPSSETPQLIATHPEGEAAGRFAQLPGVRFTEGVVFGFDSDESYGPEDAGGVVLLQATVADAAKGERFWDRASKLAHAARESEGFIRFIGFGDGLSSYGLGLWRTADQAVAFARGRAHMDAVEEQFADRNVYSQFAGVWTAHTIRPRRFFCECGHATPAPADTCAGCGERITDVFTLQGSAT